MDSCDNKDENDIVEEDVTTHVRKTHSFMGEMDSTFIL